MYPQKCLLAVVCFILSAAYSFADDRPVAVTGYPTGIYFLNEILPNAGVPADNKLDMLLPLQSYSEYSAVVWNDTVKGLATADPMVLWDTYDTAGLVYDYLAAGGRVLITGTAIPVSPAQTRKLGPAAEVIGITGIHSRKIQGKVQIIDPDHPIFAGIEIPADGFAWVADYSCLAAGAVNAKVLATALDEDGRELPFITVMEHEKGEIYWIGTAPNRLRKAEIPEADLEAFDRVLLRAITGE